MVKYPHLKKLLTVCTEHLAALYLGKLGLTRRLAVLTFLTEIYNMLRTVIDRLGSCRKSFA